MATSPIQKLIDAGMQFTAPSRKQAEKIVQKLVRAGDVQKGEAEKAITLLIERGKETTEKVTETVQREVAKQVGWMSGRFDQMEDRFEDLAEQLAGRVSSNDNKAPATKKAAAKKAPATKKAAGKKAPATKNAAPDKLAPVGSSGVRKVATKRPARSD